MPTHALICEAEGVRRIQIYIYPYRERCLYFQFACARHPPLWLCSHAPGTHLVYDKFHMTLLGDSFLAVVVAAVVIMS